MAFVKVRVPRTSQPQDVCGIDPRKIIHSAALPSRNGLNSVFGPVWTANNIGALSASVTSVGKSVRNASNGYFSRPNEVQANWISAGFVFVPESISGTVGIWSIAPSAQSDSPYVIIQRSNADIKIYAGGAFILSIPSVLRIGVPVCMAIQSYINDFGANTHTVTFVLNGMSWDVSASNTYASKTNEYLLSGYNGQASGHIGGYWSTLGKLPNAELLSRAESINSIWQIFEPEEQLIWVPDSVGAGGPATVIPIGVQANSAIGTPAAIGAAIAALTGVSATGSVGSPTATGGASIPATASPSGVSASSAVGTPAAKGAAKALPAGVQATSAVGTPLVIGGSSIPATVLPAGVAGLAYVGSPVATGQARAYPLGVQATGAVGSPVVTAGGSAVAQPQGVAASSSVGAPVARGAAVAYPLGLAGYWSVGQPVAIGQSAMPATAYPAGVSATGYVGTPVAFEASDATPSIHRAISPAQSYTATSPAQSYTAVVPAQIYST